MSAERQRRYRQRRRDGLATFSFVADEVGVTEMLVEAGYLRPSSTNDAAAISCALAEMVRVLSRSA